MASQHHPSQGRNIPLPHHQIASLQQSSHPHSPKQLPHGHLHPPTSRLAELFEAMKHEVEMVTKEASMYKNYREDLEKKLSMQINEMAAFQQALYDLERMHTTMKQKYEDEIHHLRSLLDQQNPDARRKTFEGPPPSLSTPSHPPSSFGSLSQYYDKRRDSEPQARPRDLTPLSQIKPQQQGPPLMQQISQQPPQSLPQQPPQHMPQQMKKLDPQQQRAPSPNIVQKKPEEWSLTYNQSSQIADAGINVELLHSIDHQSVVCCVKFSPDGKYIATGCNHHAQVFELASGRRVGLLEDPTTNLKEDLYIRSVCFSPDGVYLATGAEDRIIRVWDIAHKEIKVKLQGHDADIYSLDWSKDGKLIVSGSGDKTVKVWDTESGRLLNSLSNDRDDSILPSQKATMKDSGVTSVAIRPAGVCVAAGSLDEMVRVWDLRTGHLLERFQGHGNSVYSVAFSPDGQSIVSGSLDKTLRIWDLSPATLSILNNPADPQTVPTVTVTSQCRIKFSGHSDFVLSVGYPGLTGSLGRVDPSGRPTEALEEVEWIVSGSKDRHVMFWDAKKESTAVMTLQGHKNSVISIGLGPNGGLFATGSGDQKARVWRVSKSGSSHPPQLLPPSLVKQD